MGQEPAAGSPPPPPTPRPAGPPSPLRPSELSGYSGAATPAACRQESSPAPRPARYRPRPASAPLGTLPAEPRHRLHPRGTAARAGAVAQAKTEACPPHRPCSAPQPRSRGGQDRRARARSCARSALPPPAAAGPSSAPGGRRRGGGVGWDRAQPPLTPGPAAASPPPPGSAAPSSTGLGRLGRLPAVPPAGWAQGSAMAAVLRCPAVGRAGLARRNPG